MAYADSPGGRWTRCLARARMRRKCNPARRCLSRGSRRVPHYGRPGRQGRVAENVSNEFRPNCPPAPGELICGILDEMAVTHLRAVSFCAGVLLAVASAQTLGTGAVSGTVVDKESG